ncbi:hypothetical protein Tco_0523488 [Tanacetum coccineum]
MNASRVVDSAGNKDAISSLSSSIAVSIKHPSEHIPNFTTMYFYRLKDTSTPSVKLCKNGKTIKYQRRWKDSNTYRKKVPKKEFAFTLESFLDYKVLQHVAGDTDNIQSTSVVMYEREFFHADVAKPGVETIDIATGLKFNMRAMVLWTINGFPCSKLSCLGGSGQVTGITIHITKNLKKVYNGMSFTTVLNRRVPAKFNRQEKENSSAGLGRRSYLLHRSSPPLDNDPGVSESSELFALAYGPSQTLISVNSCVVNGVRFSSMLHGVTAMTLAVRPYPTTPDTPDFIQQHLQKIYNGMKAALKERYCIPDSDGTYDLERIRQTRPSHISEVNWDAQIAFWNDPKNLARLPK